MNEADIQNVLFELMQVNKQRYAFMVPNYMGLYGWECDLLGVTGYGYTHEYEIKLSLADLYADRKKQRKHMLLMSAYNDKTNYMHNVPKKFYYVIHGFSPPADAIPPYAGVVLFSHGQPRVFKEATDLNVAALNLQQVVRIAVSLSFRVFRERGANTRKKRTRRNQKKKRATWKN